MVKVREIRVKVHRGSFTLACRCWGPEDAGEDKRIIAWPGWLDNAGSFDRLAPYFEEEGYLFVAVDPPGCGWSEHMPKYAWYCNWNEALCVSDLADALGWFAPFILLGHSRGSSVCSMSAGVFGPRVRALIVVEGGIPFFGTFLSQSRHLTPKGSWFHALRMADRKNVSRKTRVFDTLEDAITFNYTNERFPKSKETGKAIVKRHICNISKDGQPKLTFTHDTNTYATPQPQGFDYVSNLAVIESISCPVMILVRATSALQAAATGNRERWTKIMKKDPMNFPMKAIESQYDYARKRLEAVKDLTFVGIKGKHHVHSDDPLEVAPRVLNWLKNKRAPPPMQHTIVPEFQIPNEERDLPFGDLLGLRSQTESFSIRPKEIMLRLRGFQLAGLQWGNPQGKRKILAWPPWRENAACFARLATEMVQQDDQICFVAFDPPGRGNSDHLPNCSFYGVCEEYPMLLRAFDAMGWKSTALMGCYSSTLVVLQAAVSLHKQNELDCLILLDPTEQDVQSSRLVCARFQAFISDQRSGAAERREKEIANASFTTFSDVASVLRCSLDSARRACTREMALKDDPRAIAAKIRDPIGLCEGNYELVLHQLESLGGPLPICVVYSSTSPKPMLQLEARFQSSTSTINSESVQSTAASILQRLESQSREQTSTQARL